jgi:hypothetical protein
MLFTFEIQTVDREVQDAIIGRKPSKRPHVQLATRSSAYAVSIWTKDCTPKYTGVHTPAIPTNHTGLLYSHNTYPQRIQDFVLPQYPTKNTGLCTAAIPTRTSYCCNTHK